MTDAMNGGRAIDWSIFLRAMAEEIDALGGKGARDALLRGIGGRMALMRPIAAAPDMDTLVMDLNDTLGEMGWGGVSFQLNEQDRSLQIVHTYPPRIGAAGDPPGTWISALLEGLYEGWMNQLPDSDKELVARRTSVTPQVVLLRYGLPATA